MKNIVNVIGTFVVTAILYAIPILTACSFIYKWHSVYQFALTVASITEFFGLCILITDEVSRGE